MSSFSSSEKRNLQQNKSQTPELNKAKTDLLSIGIDLDDDLIQRLQSNLGIERIFSVARKAATLMKDKPSPGSNPNIIYRNVAASSHENGSSLNPFQSMIHTDSKFSASVLKDLSNRSSAVEPQHRPAVDKLLESFGVMYARSPDRFVARMFGKKYKSTDKSDANSMSKLVLKARYVSQEDFTTMITRVDSTINTPLARALFLLLSEDKSFALNKKRAVVDLWGFFTLLKTAAEQSRRSFDSKTSLLASDVEFWKKKNPPNRSTTPGSKQVSNMDYTNWLDSSSIFSEDLRTAENNRRFNFEANTSAGESGQTHRTGERGARASLSVAELIGNTKFQSLNDKTHGRQVMGNFQIEFENRCDVASALHSPLKNSQKPGTPHGRVNSAETFADHGHFALVSKDDSALQLSLGRHRGHQGANSGSSQMGSVMGSTPGKSSAARHTVATAPPINPAVEREGIFGVVKVRPASASRARPFAHHHGMEPDQQRQSVASALGFGIEDGNFLRKGAHFGEQGRSAEETARLQRRNSFGRLARDDRSASVADVFKGDRAVPNAGH